MLGKIPAFIFLLKLTLRFASWFLNLKETTQIMVKSRQKIR